MADLTRAAVIDMISRGVTNFVGIDLSGLDLRNLQFPDDVDFRGADLTKTKLGGATLAKAKFTDAMLQGANFAGARLHGARFEGTGKALNCEGANFDGAEFSSASAGTSKFNNVSLHGVYAKPETFAGATLARVWLPIRNAPSIEDKPMVKPAVDSPRPSSLAFAGRSAAVSNF